MTKNKRDLLFQKKYGPWALVAGASYGLGEAWAEALARRSLNLVMLARGKEQLEATAKRLAEKYSITVKSFAIDLADFDAVKKIISSLDVPINLLVYNAAYAPISLFENTSEEQLALAAAVNVKAPLLLAKLLSAPMMQNRRGGIILMSSLSGIQGTVKLASYAATKAFNAILAEGLWKELKPHGVDVLGVCAGAISTPGYNKAEQKKAAPGALPPEKVADKALRALGRGPVVVPGSLNKFVCFLMMRLFPRRVAIDIMYKNTGGLS